MLDIDLLMVDFMSILHSIFCLFSMLEYNTIIYSSWEAQLMSTGLRKMTDLEFSDINMQENPNICLCIISHIVWGL